jgi:hypothetical protein
MTGKLTVFVSYTPISSKPGHFTITHQVQNFLRICGDFMNGSDAMLLSRSYFTLHPEQAQGIYDSLLKVTGREKIPHCSA